MSLVLLLAAAIPFAAAQAGPRYSKDGALHRVTEGNLLYTFDAVWRRESLFLLDPRTGVATAATPEEVDARRLDRLRRCLFVTLDVASLDGVPREGQDELEALRSLGYI